MANYQTFVSLRKRFVNIIFASKAVSGGQQDFLAIAIAAQAGEQFVGPCGACRFAWSPYTLSTCSICGAFPNCSNWIIWLLFRQFMAEFNPDIPIYLVRPDLEVQVCPSCLIRSFCN